MKQVVMSETADRELREIWHYIHDDQPAAADGLVRRIKRKMESCLVFPRTGRDWSELGEGIRGIAVGNYLVFFKEVPEGLLVLRVIDGRRDIRRVLGLEGQDS